MELKMLGVHLPKDLEDKLTRIASSTNRSKSYYVKEALSEYLADKEEYLLALAALEEDDGTRYDWNDVQKQLALNNDNVENTTHQEGS